MDTMRKSRLSQHEQDRLQEHFAAGTTARCAASLVGVKADYKPYGFLIHQVQLSVSSLT